MTNKTFLSYAHADAEFAHALARNLELRGIDVWVDQLKISAGSDWDECIEDALLDRQFFLIILSPAAVKSSEVKGELRLALEEAKRIVPVLYKTCRIPRQIKTLQYLDFRSSEPESTSCFDTLLQALNGEPQTDKLSGSGTPAENLEVDLSDLLGVPTVIEYPYRSEQHFQEFLNQIFVKYLMDAGTIPPYTYDSHWRFVDQVTEQPIRRSARIEVAGQAHDGRYLKEPGIMPRMNLRAIQPMIPSSL